jgi:hypothetical protein
LASLQSRLGKAAAALLGVSAYAPQRSLVGAPEIDDPQVERAREAMGGQLEMPTATRTRWMLADLETAQRAADQGDMSMVAQICRSFRRDGTISGLMHTRTAGLVALPRTFAGDPTYVAALEAPHGLRNVFDEMFPPAELARMAADGLGPGVGVGELVPVVGRDFPVLVRHEPEHLRYRWTEDRWYFNSIAGQLPITPGDGRWILHTPGGRMTPWNAAGWQSLGRSFITKEHALLHRGNFGGKLANPARVAHAPQAATDEQKLSFLRSLMAWGINTVIALPPGYKAELLESNGRGWEVYGKEIETADLEAMIYLAGQVVTTTGGTGFANADIHKTIRADLINETGITLAHTINTQGIPAFLVQRFGPAALQNPARVQWNTEPPEDREAESKALTGLGDAVDKLQAILLEHGIALDVNTLVRRFRVPILADPVKPVKRPKPVEKKPFG